MNGVSYYSTPGVGGGMERRFPTESKGQQAAKAGLQALITNLKEFSKIEAERAKIKGDILINKIKAKDNWFYKMQEKAHQPPEFGQMFQRQQAQGYDPFSGEPQMRVGAEGKVTPKYPSQDVQLYNYLKRKKTDRPREFDEMDERRLTGLEKKVFGAGEDKPYEGTAEWKKKNAQSTLFVEWMKSLQDEMPESKWDRYSPTWSKKEIVRELLAGNPRYKTSQGKVDVVRTLKALDLTIDDFYSWATENQLDLARIAFPGRIALE